MFSIAAVFSDNMVLQRGKNVAVWGESDGGSRVRVSVAGSEANKGDDASKQIGCPKVKPTLKQPDIQPANRAMNMPFGKLKSATAA